MLLASLGMFVNFSGCSKGRVCWLDHTPINGAHSGRSVLSVPFVDLIAQIAAAGCNQRSVWKNLGDALFVLRTWFPPCRLWMEKSIDVLSNPFCFDLFVRFAGYTSHSDQLARNKDSWHGGLELLGICLGSIWTGQEPQQTS